MPLVAATIEGFAKEIDRAAAALGGGTSAAAAR